MYVMNTYSPEIKKPRILNRNISATEFLAEKWCREIAIDAGQGHIFRWWKEITHGEKQHLLDQIASIEFPFIKKIFFDTRSKTTHSIQHHFSPPHVIPIPGNENEKERSQMAKQMGEGLLKKGEAAILTVAGGQGTRLGSNGPKGTLPIGPISGKSIFQLHAEKLLALQKRYHTTIPWYIMTSESNDAITRDFFHTHRFFGFEPRDVCFFTQRMLPVVDLRGNLLMDSKWNIVTSPNGHGGTIIALREKGVFHDMKRRGIKNIFYHQVDNVLIKIADPVFAGYHLMDNAEFSSKIVKKRHPEEKVGIIVQMDGRLHLIEYSELNREDMYAKDENGTLKYNAGSIAVHMISIDFLEKVYNKVDPLPYHAALKKVPYLDEKGEMINPEKNNAIKFESFIFDVLKHVENGVIMEVPREDEFSPIKNMEGENSPATARQDMINLFGRWLRSIGVSIPTDTQGNVNGLIEINPCFALDEEELRNKIGKHLQFNGNLSL